LHIVITLSVEEPGSVSHSFFLMIHIFCNGMPY